MSRRVLMCLPGSIPLEREWVGEYSYQRKDLEELGWEACTHLHVRDIAESEALQGLPAGQQAPGAQAGAEVRYPSQSV